MNLRKFFPVIFISLAVSCAQDERVIDPGIEPESEYTSFDRITTDCTDAKMSRWFELFHHYQDAGLDMYEADEKARKQVESSFKACDGNHSRVRAEKKTARR